MNAVWIIETAKAGTNYWHFYSAEDDIGSPEEMVERLKLIQSAVNEFRGVQYVRDNTTIVDRPRMPYDVHSVGRECASVDAINGNHCQHYHRGGTCCDCGVKFNA